MQIHIECTMPCFANLFNGVQLIREVLHILKMKYFIQELLQVSTSFRITPAFYFI